MLLQNQNNRRFHAAAAQANPTYLLPHDEQTATALANLASATAADRTALASLTTANERLSLYIE